MHLIGNFYLKYFSIGLLFPNDLRHCTVTITRWNIAPIFDCLLYNAQIWVINTHLYLLPVHPCNLELLSTFPQHHSLATNIRILFSSWYQRYINKSDLENWDCTLLAIIWTIWSRARHAHIPIQVHTPNLSSTKPTFSYLSD